MSKTTIAIGTAVLAIVLLGVIAAYWGTKPDVAPATDKSLESTAPVASPTGLSVAIQSATDGGAATAAAPEGGTAADAPAPSGDGVHASAPSETTATAEAHQGFLYGRITTTNGAVYEGRIRFGGNQEAFWGDYFNGAKRENTWAALVTPERLPRTHHRIEIFGFKIADREEAELGRPFQSRMGDLARVESKGRDVRVTLKSGTVFHLDRFDSSDFDDGLRVWDVKRGVVDLDSLQVRMIEFLPTPALGDAPVRLHGTVHARQGDFTGYLQWDLEKGSGSDELAGLAASGEKSIRFDTIRSIARRTGEDSVATLLDGREITLSRRGSAGSDNRGIYVDDPRYGRVRISRETFERVDFAPAGSGPGYRDFPVGSPLKGGVTTRDGRRLSGRLVFDLDESETTEMLDAPFEGVDYTIPFGLIASIAPHASDAAQASSAEDKALVRIRLRDGEELRLERSGDLGDGNGGMLIFAGSEEKPAYVPWADIAQIDFDPPLAMYPPPPSR